jgi:hypothetical protein
LHESCFYNRHFNRDVINIINVMNKGNRNSNEYEDHSPYQSYMHRNYKYSLSHDKFVVPWQMEVNKQRKKNSHFSESHESA